MMKKKCASVQVIVIVIIDSNHLIINYQCYLAYPVYHYCYSLRDNFSTGFSFIGNSFFMQ